MRPTGTICLTLPLFMLAACDSPSGSSRPGPAAQLEILAGDLQPNAVAGAELPEPLVVRVTDAQGRPVPNQIVNFRVTAGGGSVFAGAAETNQNGEARDRWTLGTVAGDTQRVEVRAVDPATGEPLVFGTFRAVARPDAPAAIAVAENVPLSGPAGAPLTPAVVVRDRFSNPVPGASVSWAVTSGGGSLSTATSTTDAQGIARTQWTLGGSLAAPQGLSASVGPSITTTLTATATLGPGAQLARVSGDAQEGAPGTELPQPLVVELRQNGVALQGVQVLWTTTSGSLAGPSNGVTVTDAAGRTSVRWRLGAGLGSQTVTAQVGSAGSAIHLQTTFSGTAIADRPSDLAAVAVGSEHTCALTGAGQAYCWGRNLEGQLGDGTLTSRTAPTRVAQPDEVTFTALAAGPRHTCGITPAGQAYCWGLVRFDPIRTPTPVSQPSGVALRTLAAGGSHTCGLTSGGEAWCWGSNSNGQLGNPGSNGFSAAPVHQPSGVSFTSLVAGSVHTCGLTPGGTAYCWGANSQGQLGNGQFHDASTPVAVAQPGGVSWSSLGSAGYHTCALTSSGQAYCWGQNAFGELGDGTTTNRNTPVAVAQPSGVTFSAMGTGRTPCALTAAGQAYCWGANNNGQLGDNSLTNRTAPVRVHQPGGVAFTLIQSGGSHTCALSTAGALYCWGANSFGQLGDGTITRRLAPVMVQPPG